MKRILIFLLFFTTLVFSQEKYLIYFKDKGINTEKVLSKNADKEIVAKKTLSKRSIERRKKSSSENYFTFQDLPILEKYLEILSDNKIKIIHKLKWFNAASAYLDNKQIEFLLKQNFIEKIEKIKKAKRTKPIKTKNSLHKILQKSTTKIENKYDYGTSITQNELSQIPKVHNLGITGKNIIIGLLDSGFDWQNKTCLNQRDVIAEYDFVFKDKVTANESNDDADQHNHGTSVFSIIAGFDEGKLIGPAFNSKYLLAKTEYIPTETHTEQDNFAAALEWMDSIGVDVVSASLGYNEFDEGESSYTYENMDGKTTIVTKAAEIAFSKGIVVLNSAGNEGNKSWKYILAPADGKNVIAVGAVNSDNNLAAFSSRGPTYDGRIKPQLTAMGVNVKHASASSKIDYSYGNGTSFSEPIVAGIAGLLLSAYPHLTNKQVRTILLESGNNTEAPNNNVGYGLLSAIRAITYPNLKKVNDTYILNKIFDKTLKVDSTSVELVFVGGNKYPMTKTGLTYQLQLPFLTKDSNYQFYFNYVDSSQNVVREPKDKNYNLRYGSIYIDLVLTSIEESEIIADDFQLAQNYPNPFNPESKIEFTIPKGFTNVNVSLKIYDILGREISTIAQGKYGEGIHTVSFSSTGLSSGVYFYRLQAGNFVKTKKMIVIK
ncbi:MAG: hypothetical protein CR986_05120 [Ignavibacteriae bacterium]|nr:MAG: hypothetical protein CR986_05120 [Ignavibacteriota bacterium]